jgi:hypothetical protein
VNQSRKNQGLFHDTWVLSSLSPRKKAIGVDSPSCENCGTAKHLGTSKRVAHANGVSIPTLSRSIKKIGRFQF